jgi:hypothetical protein
MLFSNGCEGVIHEAIWLRRPNSTDGGVFCSAAVQLKHLGRPQLENRLRISDSSNSWPSTVFRLLA